VEYSRINLENAEYQLNNFLVQTITLPSTPATPVNPGTEQTRPDVYNTFFDLKIERDEIERDRTAIERALGGGAEPLSIDALSAVAAVTASPELSQALEELTTKRAEMRALMRLYTMEHRTALNAAEDLSNLETRVIPQLARNVMGEMTARMAVLDGMIASRTQELREIPPRAIDEARFQRNVEIAATLYNDVSQRYENARLATATTTPDVSILSRATPAQFPTSDTRLRLLAMFVAAGLGAGIGLAILLDLLDKRLRYPEQISNGMRLSILGAIPDLTTRRIGFGSVQPDATELVEALRSVRLSLAHAHGAAGPLMVTITSPGAGDGKTFLTSNLAATFAELGMRVLVIDGDTRRGSLHRVLNLDRKPGLTDYLINGAQVLDVIRPTSIALLDVIPCGTRSPKAPELLSSQRMGDLLAEIRPRYDVILVDSPPLGAGIDPLVLSTITGSVVLVMRTGKTDRSLAEAKLAVLDRLPVRVLGAVMNGIATDAAFRYYSYLPGYEAGQEDPDERDRFLQPG
jgi:capsular exopolysaccharide synthesis family protein